jgi:hypothetical protein
LLDTALRREYESEMRNLSLIGTTGRLRDQLSEKQRELEAARETLREIKAISSQVAGTAVEYLGRLTRISELASDT